MLSTRQRHPESPLAFVLGLLGFLLLTFQVACGGGSSTPPPPAPVITSFAVAKAPLTAGTSTTLTAVFTNGTGVINQGVGTVTSATPATISPTTTTTYTLTVTNSAGVAATSIVTVPVVPAPVASSLSPGVNPVPYGGTTPVTPTFTDGVGTVDNGVGTVTSGTSFSSGVITAPKTFTLVVANTAGSTATKTLTLTPQTVALGALSPAAPVVTAATSASFTLSVAGGATNTVTWMATGGSWSGSTWTAPATTGTYTLTATSVDDPTKSVSTTATVIAPPSTPVITKPTLVTAGQAGYAASVPAQVGMTFAWTLTNGTVTAGAGTNSITFTAGSAVTTVDLVCVATNLAGTHAPSASVSATVVAAPLATSLVAGVNPVLYGGTTTVTPTFSNGTATVNGTAATSGTAIASGTITAAKTFTLVVTNAAGSTASATLTLNPQTVALTALSPAAPTRTVGTSTTFSTTATGGVTNTVTWTASTGSITSTGVWTAPATAGTATITATSVDDASKTASTTVTVVGLPTLPVVSAPTFVTASLAGFTASVPTQTGVTFAWTVTGATVTAGAGTSGITFTPAASGTVTFSVVATNAAGTPSTAGTGSSTIVAAPLAASLVAATNPVLMGGSTTVTPTFSAGTGSVDNRVGVVTSGTPFSTGIITDPRIYTLTVTNQAGTSTTATLTVRPQTVSVASITPTTPTVTVGTTTLFTANVTGAVNTAVFWSSTGGSWASNAWTAPSTPGTYTVTAISAVEPSKSATTSVTVVAAPVYPEISAPTAVTTARGGYTAFVGAQASVTYTWTITNGTITAGDGTRSVTFTAGPAGSVALTCVVANLTGATATDTVLVPIVPYPVIHSFAATKGDVLSGGASTLSAAYVGGTGVVTPGGAALASGFTAVVNPTHTTTYTLTVTNTAGDTATENLTITVGALPSISLFRASPTAITAGQGTLLSFSFTGTGVIDQGVGSVTSGSQVAVTPASTTTYTLTVTNAAGATTTATATVTVLTFTSKFAYVANSGGGISGYTLNDTTGDLTEMANSPFAVAVNFLHVTSDSGGRYLYAVNGDGLTTPMNALTAFTIDATTGELTEIGTYPTDVNPWAAAVDPSAQYVYVRCEGAISIFALNGGTGALTARPQANTAAGTGDVLVHPSGRQLYTVGRTSDLIEVFDINPSTGALVAHSSTGLPANTGALSLALDRSGEYLFTKTEGAAGGGAQACILYTHQVDVESGVLTPLAPTDTGLEQADAYHGVSANPTQSVIYITLATTFNDYAAFAFDLVSGTLTPLTASPYDLFGGTGSDSLVVSRNGKWGLITNYNGAQVAIGAIDPSTGALLTPTTVTSGSFPICVTVVGTVL